MAFTTTVLIVPRIINFQKNKLLNRMLRKCSCQSVQLAGRLEFESFYFSSLAWISRVKRNENWRFLPTTLMHLYRPDAPTVRCACFSDVACFYFEPKRRLNFFSSYFFEFTWIAFVGIKFLRKIRAELEFINILSPKLLDTRRCTCKCLCSADPKWFLIKRGGQSKQNDSASQNK